MDPELIVPVQLVFASSTDDGVVLDCTVVDDVVTDDTVIPFGSPFTLWIDRVDPDGRRPAAELLGLLRSWCASGVVVEATTSASSRQLRLRHAADEVVLEVT